MIIVLCPSCHTGLRVRAGEDPTEVDLLVGPRSDLWQRGFFCWKCGQKVVAYLERQVSLDVLKQTHLRDLTCQELFQQQSGLGLPEERACTRAVIEPLLLSHKILKVCGHNIPNTERFCLESLVLEDGTVLHLDASTHGATIYRVVSPLSHTQQVLDEHERSSPLPPSDGRTL